MADPRLFDVPVHVAQEAALAALGELLADHAEAQQTFAEKYGNPHLAGSPASLVEVVAQDHQVREEHGLAVVTQALVHVLRAQQKRIEVLETAAKAGAKRS
jgi:hypothetical protein